MQPKSSLWWIFHDPTSLFLRLHGRIADLIHLSIINQCYSFLYIFFSTFHRLLSSISSLFSIAVHSCFNIYYVSSSLLYLRVSSVYLFQLPSILFPPPTSSIFSKLCLLLSYVSFEFKTERKIVRPYFLESAIFIFMTHNLSCQRNGETTIKH